MGQLRTKIGPILRFFSPSLIAVWWQNSVCIFEQEAADIVSLDLAGFDRIWYSLSDLHIGKSGTASVSCKCKEGWTMMKDKKRYLYLNDEETRLVVQSLIRFKNKLQQRGRYTDCVDELILKVSDTL